MHSAQPKPRRLRHDIGSVRLTERDIDLLRFTGEQYAVSSHQLAHLMEAGVSAAYHLVSRWKRANWARGRVVLAGRPPFIWLTAAGTRIADLPFTALEPSPGRLAHISAVVDVRLWVQGRRPHAVWRSERYLPREHVGGLTAAHRPDALVSDEGQTVAVEVELSTKAPDRLEAIVASLLASYPAVWYFAAPGPAKLLAEIAERVGADRLQVLPLP